MQRQNNGEVSALLYPQERYHRITDIPVESLRARGVRTAILDVDNTLTTHGNPDVAPGVVQWIACAAQNGIRCIVLSNNSPERVRPFAQALNIDFVSRGRKPLGGGFLRARIRTGASKKETVVIGDQIFTDVLGARLAGLYCIFVDPIEPETGWFFRFKRRLERPILLGYERRKIRRAKTGGTP
jgi:HAD superfamily phosphatase (TIGR01668 family)